MKEIKCPKCGSQNVIEIMYGLPSAEAGESAARGEIKLGGCCRTNHDPSHYCKNCNYRFGKRKDI